MLRATPFKSHPEFKKRMQEILDEAYPGDYEGKRVSMKVQTEYGLKQYGRLYGDKARAEIRTPVAGGKVGAGGAGGAPKAVTSAMMEEAKKRWGEAPDANGHGWGKRQRDAWAKAGLLDKPPEEE